MAVLSKLVNALSPKSKNWLFNVSKGSINGQMTQLTLAAIVQIIVFFERPDILYCKPECVETVYCRKDSKGEKLYKPKDYLLWRLHETLTQFSSDENFTQTYYMLHNIACEQKDIFHARYTAENGSWCEKWENHKLLSTALKKKWTSHQMLHLKLSKMLHLIPLLSSFF